MYALACDDVSVAFGDRQVLDRVSVRFTGPAVVAVVGANGAGKSTLFDVLSGFRRADRGAVAVNGRRAAGLRPDAVARLGLVRTFQDLQLPGQLTALEAVQAARPGGRGDGLLAALFGPRPLAAERAEAAAGLDRVGLGAAADRPVERLSYGQRKLLALACAAAAGAGVLLLDEPFAGVHPAAAAVIRGVISDWRAAGRLVVFVDHDLTAVRAAAERVVRLEDGRVVADGATADVCSGEEFA